MVRSVQSLILAAMIVVPSISFASVIQPVGYECGEGCCDTSTDGCNSCKQKQSRRSKKRDRKNDYCDACDSSGRKRCGLRSTWQDFGTNWTGSCGPIGRAARMGFPGAKCLKWCMDTKGSGDSGWAPPARMPVNRTHTGFGSYASQGGRGYGGAPMVYQPTDTAQLGYRYAHVPTWRSNPHMIPATPVPSNFHARFCPPNAGSGVHMNPGCMTMDSGIIMNGGMMMESQMHGGDYCPSCVATPSPAAAPRSSTEAVVHLSQARKPNSTVSVTKTPVRIAAPEATNPIRLTAQLAQEAPMPQVKATPPQIKLTPPAVQIARPQIAQPKIQLPQLPPQQWQQPQVQVRQQQPRQTKSAQPQRRSANRRPQQKKSGGWFGLPSLGDVKF